MFGSRHFNNYTKRIIERYNLYNRTTLLPIHEAKEESKCKDYDMDNMDLTNMKKYVNKNNVKTEEEKEKTYLSTNV